MCISLEKICYEIVVLPSLLVFLIRSSHTNFDDNDENPTLASLTIFPSVPYFSANVQVL